MRLIADLHIHSHYSRATSKDLDFEHLARWAQLKGVQIVGTGDIAHPGWLQEMRDKLVPAEEGLFQLKPEIAATVGESVPPACRGPVRFLLAGEISNIYKRHDAVRKVHNVIFAPGLDVVERIQGALEKIGNIRSDGRPILGLDSRDLLETVLECDPHCHLIPAHIWTPWFSMLGSKSGFGSVEECFGDLTSHIFALETGLSSDPPMNWRVSNLDRYTLVSNSDAHSPAKLAREATIFHTEPSYEAIFAALRSGDPGHFGGTVEFFPEEGKYHMDGHRACGVRWTPAETRAHGGICPVCGKGVTVGVMHRVEELADRPPEGRPERTQRYYSLIPLPELLGEVHGVGASSRKVQQEYARLLGRLGPELNILLDTPLEQIAAAGGTRLAEAVHRMRKGEISAQGGYDGEYGVIRALPAAPLVEGDQPGLFGDEQPVNAASNEAGAPPVLAAPQATAVAVTPEGVWTPMGLFESATEPAASERRPAPGAAAEWLERLNPDQAAAVACVDRPLIIVAGPGAGKTRTLTVRMARLVQAHGVAPHSILAITFTNKAAGEMAERLATLLGEEAAQITVRTFHALAAQLLRSEGAALGLPQRFAIMGEEERARLLRQACTALGEGERRLALERISDAKNRLLAAHDPLLAAENQDDPGFLATYAAYQRALAAAQAVDFDDLLLLAVQLLEQRPSALAAVQARYRWISVDEYQDINLAQYRLLRLLAGNGANLCVIGDPDQAIYGFRGADRRYFLSFTQDYPGARLLRLTQSYRSPQSLLDAAAQVLAAGSEGHGERLLSDFVEEVKLESAASPTDRAEAESIVHRIEQMVGGLSYFSLDSGRTTGEGPARPFSDFAVLYRLSAQSQTLIEAFERSGIPYQAPGQTPLAAHQDVRRVLAHLWLLYNPGAPAHLEALLGAGEDSATGPAAAVHRLILEQGLPWQTALRDVAALLRRKPAQRRRLGALIALHTELAAKPEQTPVVDLVRHIVAHEQPESGAGDVAAQERAARLLRRAAAYGPRLGDFLEAMALQGEMDEYDPRADRVALMTLHAAKGLEFPVVFIAGCEEGLTPYLHPNRETDIEEERRLFYVGMTRAREKLVLTRAESRLLFGRRSRPAESRFLGDIEAALKDVQERAHLRAVKEKATDAQLSLF